MRRRRRRRIPSLTQNQPSGVVSHGSLVTARRVEGKRRERRRKQSKGEKGGGREEKMEGQCGGKVEGHGGMEGEIEVMGKRMAGR